MAEHDDGGAVRSIVGGRQRPAERGAHAEDAEVVTGHDQPGRMLDAPAGSEREPFRACRREAAQRAVSVAVHKVVGKDDVGIVVLEDPDQPVGIGAREWSGDDRIPDAEDEDVHAEPDGERRNRQQAESGIAREEPQPEPNVLRQVIEEGQAVPIPVKLSSLLPAAERRERQSPRFGGMSASANMLVDVKLEVTVELGVELASGSCAREHAAQPADRCEPAPHDRPFCGSRKRARMSAVCRQSSAWRSACRRPARVSV